MEVSDTATNQAEGCVTSTTVVTQWYILVCILAGFEISLGPHYIATSGLAWLERGGVYVEANIRGGTFAGARALYDDDGVVSSKLAVRTNIVVMTCRW